MSTTVTRVFDLLQHSLEKFPQEAFLTDKATGKWRSFSTQQFCEAVDSLSKGLLGLGVTKGSKVAVMSANRIEWNITDFAISQIGAFQVPLYPTLPEHDVNFILRDAGVSVVFAATADLHAKIAQAGVEGLQIYTFDAAPGLKNWETLAAQGRDVSADLQQLRNAVTPEDVLTLIYTSGTTGTPKGVMLTHNNLVQNFLNSAIILPAGIRTALSFLPLSHIFERMVIYLYIYSGISVAYAESMDTIVADIQYTKPDVFTTVPRLLEKVYDKIMEKGKALSGAKRGIFFWSLALANAFDFRKGRWYDLRLALARKLVFKKWQEALGGNIRAIISGGAALNPKLARIFWAAGLPVFEGYGLTETSPVIAVNRPDETMFGTVGPALNGVEIKIAADGEILTRGHHIMKGYYNRPELTAEALDAEGWFHTGDIGELVDQKYLKITDRKKEMFKTAGGKYVAPQLLENKFKESPLIEQVMVIGENRKFPSALIVPAFEALKNWCAKKGISYQNSAQIIANEQVKARYEELIADYNKEFGRWEQVKQIILLPKEWSIEGGELTPKLSLKRKVILEKNKANIEKLYEDAERSKGAANH
ncbi:long-chain fatty acid--CoA ligase [Pedobacter yulinensis]|uniref:Long-chain fatty acid--CoA ligase n=1 Tax=Pedobacter yulinensis TaxID=2126353 RepID=A0A2T3HPI1_9SPHI|nr:AMP-dependent synthetase/ligase [Pedobacter yulinensis]PST84358.1 long-chain fatty acid--CoA ligase [Pedobacter yulinensis]